jgi:hypothetical protein
MAVSVAVTRVACNTSTGTQDITITAFGTPKAALFICSEATTDGTAASNYQLSVGAATGVSNEWCLSVNSEDGQASADTQSSTDSDRVIRINTAGTNTVDGDAEFTAFITDGVRINWITAPSAAWLLTVVLFGGDDLSAHANSVGLGDATDNAVDITAPGFEPTLIIAACNDALAMDANQTHIEPSIGFVHNGVGVSHGNATVYMANGAANGSPDGRCTESYGVMGLNTSGGLDWGGEFGSFDSSGFTVTTRNAGANSTSLMYLALGLAGTEAGYVGTVNTPTSTGNDGQTGPGFTPQAVLQIGTHMEAIDTAYNSSPLAGALAAAAFDASNEYMTSVNDEDAAATINTQCLSDNTAVELPNDDGTAGLTASFVSMDANGYTLNYSAVTANAKKFFVMAVEEPSGALSVNVSDVISLAESIGREVGFIR